MAQWRPRVARGTTVALRPGMRSRTLLGDVQQQDAQQSRPDTYEAVRKTLDEALAELQLPRERDDSGVIQLPPNN